jgi:hypothetical protein
LRPPTSDPNRQDYGGHDSQYHDNLNLVHKYDGQNCINTAPFVADGTPPCAVAASSTGLCDHQHHFERNRCLVLYTDVYGANIGGCPPNFTPGTTSYLANNKYYSPTAGNASISCSNNKLASLAELQKAGLETGSTSEGLPPPSVWQQWAEDTLNMTLPLRLL